MGKGKETDRIKTHLSVSCLKFKTIECPIHYSTHPPEKMCTVKIHSTHLTLPFTELPFLRPSMTMQKEETRIQESSVSAC